MEGCVRIEVRSEQESKGFREAERFQAAIPVLAMRLSSDGFRDPYSGVVDVLRGEYRFLGNSEYRRSPLYRAGRDLGFFAVLSYVKALLEDGAEPSADTESQVRDSVQYAQAPEQHDYLRARAFYLLASISGVSAAQGRWQELFDQFGLGNAIKTSKLFASSELASEHGIINLDAPLIVSAWLGARTYRFPTRGDEWTAPNSQQRVPEGKEVAWDQECFLDSPWLKLSAGAADCEVHGTAFGMEFVHMLLDLQDELSDIPDYEMTACWYLKGTSRQNVEVKEELLLPAPTVCQRLADGQGPARLAVRCNLLNLGGLSAAFENVQAKVFLLCPRKDNGNAKLRPFPI